MTNSQITSQLTIWWKAESFLLKLRDNTRVSTVNISTQHSTGSTSRIIKQEKEIKGIQTGKEEVNFSFCK